MIKKSHAQQIFSCLDEGVIAVQPLSGGCIAQAFCLELSSGKQAFYKTTKTASDMFHKEANGLQALAQTNSIRIPQVWLAGQDFLLLEYISPKSKSRDFFSIFGRQLAALHQNEATSFGFYEDNYIGASIQNNHQVAVTAACNSTLWPEYYFQYRILFQLKLAEQNRLATQELVNLVNKLEKKIEAILDYSDATPRLLHGDLWSGNFLIDGQGNPCLIDPAVYYGHHEAELAMTKLFGGFPPEFYQSYQAVLPLEAGWEYRENIYNLYHMMNHLNLFGGSYYGQTIELLRYYL